MFAKGKITQSMIDAVNSVLGETKEEVKQVLLDEGNKRLLKDDELDETGFHKAAHAAKRANQSHFEFQGKKYPVTAKSHAEALAMEASEKVPTPTGMKVYGSSYGNSKKARADQTKHSVDDVKEPSKKELTGKNEEVELEESDCVTKPQAKDIAKKEVGKHEKGMHGKKGEVAQHVKSMHKESTFADKLIASLNEAKSTGTEEIFTDNNLGEGEMSDAQMKKRERIVMSMKKGEAGFKQRYGKNWKNVMYATATKQAMKEDSSDYWEGEQLDEWTAKKVAGGSYAEKSRKLMAKAASKLQPQQEMKVTNKKSDDGMKLINTPHRSHPDMIKLIDKPLRRSGGKDVREDIELDEATPAKNTDIADKAYLKHKPGTVKGTMTQLGRFLRGKPEIKESLDEANITHAAHFDDPKTGKWASMALLTAKNDAEAVMQAKDLLRTDAYRHYKLSAVEKHEPVKMKMKEEAELHESLMGHIEVKAAKKHKDPEILAVHDVHYKGKKVGDIQVYQHGSGMKYGSHHDATGNSTAGHRTMDQAIDDIRQEHAQHLKSMKEEVEHLNEDETLKAIAKKHGMKYHPGTYGANMSHATKGYVNVNRYGEWGHYKQGRFDRGHGLATAHGDSSQHFKDLDKHLGTLKEGVEVQMGKDGDKVTTDMLRGREAGGKSNAFKSFKQQLKTNGEMKAPTEIDTGTDTKEKQKITTNPGAVDVKFDDKLSTPPQHYFSNEKQIANEAFRGEMKVAHAKSKAVHSKDVATFNKKVTQKEEIQIDEKTIAGTPGWEKMPKDVKDKSGAVHTPMSRARDLAKKSFKKLKKETMMGKIGTSE